MCEARDWQTEGEAKKPIIVTGPLSEGERRKQLRDFTMAILRLPRRSRSIARFCLPICAEVRGRTADEERGIEDRVVQNVERLASGANRDENCPPHLACSICGSRGLHA